jgi:hypothetical protein
MAHVELRRMTVLHRASQRPRQSWVTTYQPCCTTALESQRTRLGKAAWGKDVPPCGFAASPRVGPGATVGTLRTRYPRVQALSQYNGSRLPAGGSFGAAMCPRGSDSCLPARGSSGAITCPHGSGFHLPARGSSGVATCHLGSSTHLLAQGSSKATMCPEDGLCRL